MRAGASARFGGVASDGEGLGAVDASPMGLGFAPAAVMRLPGSAAHVRLHCWHQQNVAVNGGLAEELSN